MKPTAILVILLGILRLLKGLYALEEGRIPGAGLNVYAKEFEGEPALIRIKNFILEPHNVSISRATCLWMATVAA